MKNKIKILLPLLLLIFAIPVFAQYISGKITNVEIYKVGDKVYIDGETEGFTSKMRILIKVLDDYGNLQFFDEIPIDSNGKFSDSFIPMDIKDNTYLNFNISGDLAYSTKFYYSSDYIDDNDRIERILLETLQSYKYYKDNNSKYSLNFVFSYEQGANKGNVILTGTNFVKGDTLWNGKNDNVWNSYLSTIKQVSTNITGKTITLYVYDKQNNLLQNYPIIIGDNESDEKEEDNKPIDGIISDIGNNVGYSSNGNSLSFNPSLLESTSKYIKIKFTGDFSKEDDCWTLSSLVDLENFSRSIAEKLNIKYNSDFDFFFYDKNNKILNSYSYYYYKGNQGQETGDEQTGGSGGTDEGTGNSPTITPIPGSDDDNGDNGSTTDDNQVYKVWTPYDDLGIYTLNLMIYSYNSSTIDAQLESEGYEGAVYKYNYVLNDYDTVFGIVNSLRNDSKKVLVVRGNTLGSNINFKVSSDIVELLKSNNVTLIFDTSYIKVEADFSTCSYSGEFVITTNETIAMLTDKATDAFNVNITLGGMDVSNLFSHKVKLALHYTYESASNISDLRFVNNYYNNSTSLNTTVNESLKAFISNYYGSGIYCSKANTYIFNDNNFEDNSYRRYAEIVASKGLMEGSAGVFNPKQTITRGEFVSYIARKMGVSSNINYFSDLSNISPYFGAINGTFEIGILPPTWRGNCNIDKKITIEEMIYIIVRCYEVNSLNSTSYGSALYYKDTDDISAWAKNKIAIASKLGIIPSDGYLYPTENGTKEDAAELLFKLLDIEGIF